VLYESYKLIIISGKITMSTVKVAMVVSVRQPLWRSLRCRGVSRASMFLGMSCRGLGEVASLTQAERFLLCLVSGLPPPVLYNVRPSGIAD